MAAPSVLVLSRALQAIRGSRFSSTYRSAYSLDRLYPGSDLRTVAGDQGEPDIPVDRLTISYCKSSGPGGQNVNKVNTKAEVRFHLASADWIPDDARQKISVQCKNRINRSGELIVVSEQSRYQMENLSVCLEKIRSIVSDAMKRPKMQTKEDVDVRRARVEKSNRERLRQKKIESSLKQSRQLSVD
ncbi:peptidyl-tRNA hydrolase ICT1, mitochondrial isoform X2 [Xenopus laevis]|uniref:Large ribosomal subunit protein mL62 n=1 Tax=Xenopus laevis TaxID=8355 RepID=A0A8J0TZV8_XENLA|nr:peptidyl-tRNA hydrolase ICT1, mitochondrial isoform X2 [Xenopus laevis]